MLRTPEKGINCQERNTVANTVVDTLEDNLKVTTDHQSKVTKNEFKKCPFCEKNICQID